MDLKELKKFTVRFSSLSDQMMASLRDMPEVVMLTEEEFEEIKDNLGYEDNQYWIGPRPFERVLTQQGAVWVWHNPYYGASTSGDTGTGSNPVGT